MINRRLISGSPSGFTIIELLIAMSVVSFILLLASVMISSIGSLYYKGISQARVQDDVRAITDDISQHLQLTDSGPTPSAAGPHGSLAYCIGNTRYNYILNKQIGTGGTTSAHVLWRDTIASGTCPPAADVTMATPSSGGTELISPRSRLTNFSITTASPYDVTVRVVFGDDELLCDTGHSDCNSKITSSWLSAPSGTIMCKGSKATSGQQFCGVANLTTTVVQRLH